MRRFAGSVGVALALLALSACQREPVKTVVVPPRHSLPDDTPLQAGAPIAPPAAPPVAAAPAAPPLQPAPPSDPLPQSQPAPAVAALPSVRSPGDAQGAQLLAERTLQVPVVGIRPERLADSYEQGRGQRTHEAMDVLAPRGTPVVAVDDGRIAKLFTSKPGGLTVYHFDQQQRLAYYYAHLDRYADGLHEGMAVKRGDLIGYVGTSGNSDPGTPHLHFAVFRLGADAKWWQGDPVNPYPAFSRAAPSATVAAAR
jgi:murein DD-endopeptidase MepM/ murein hydrolase activator NlpD